ncbi:hypothetical protein PPACK8108_LOCUS23760, partial [Phakopsora pachyrhizi]
MILLPYVLLFCSDPIGIVLDCFVLLFLLYCPIIVFDIVLDIVFLLSLIYLIFLLLL